MKFLIFLIGPLFFNGALLASEINLANTIPAWIQIPPDNTAAACSTLARGKLVAQKIAKAKALAELGRTQKVNVKSNQEIESKVDHGKLINSSFKETTAITSDELFEAVGVIDQAEVNIDGNMQLCVLVARLEKVVRD